MEEDRDSVHDPPSSSMDRSFLDGIALKFDFPSYSSSSSSPSPLTITDGDDNHNGSSKSAFSVDSLPLGFRFTPTDQELIVHYLRKRDLNEELPSNRIHEVNLYEYNPELLTEKYGIDGENECYIFTPRERRHLKGKRPSRKACDGFWKSNSSGNKDIYLNGVKVGFRKLFVYYKGNRSYGLKTSWLMREYTLYNPPQTQTTANSWLDECVLCKVYKKNEKSNTTANEQRHNDGIRNEVLEISGFQNQLEEIGMNDNENPRIKKARTTLTDEARAKQEEFLGVPSPDNSQSDHSLQEYVMSLEALLEDD